MVVINCFLSSLAIRTLHKVDRTFVYLWSGTHRVGHKRSVIARGKKREEIYILAQVAAIGQPNQENQRPERPTG